MKRALAHSRVIAPETTSLPHESTYRPAFHPRQRPPYGTIPSWDHRLDTLVLGNECHHTNAENDFDQDDPIIDQQKLQFTTHESSHARSINEEKEADEVEYLELTSKQEDALYRKVDMRYVLLLIPFWGLERLITCPPRVLPILCVLWFFCYMDRANIGKYRYLGPFRHSHDNRIPQGTPKLRDYPVNSTWSEINTT